jgi:hypothetical protein
MGNNTLIINNMDTIRVWQIQFNNETYIIKGFNIEYKENYIIIHSGINRGGLNSPSAIIPISALIIEITYEK